MRLYTCSGAPSPERVALYLRLKGITLDLIEIDLRQGEHMKPAFIAKSPEATVPVLELDDGRTIWESAAIRRYLESRFPEPALFGADAEARAVVDMWTDWVLFNGLLPVMEAFRNHFPGFRDHALPGRDPVAQIPELVSRGRARYQRFLERLDERLSSSTFVAGEDLSVADIDAYVVIGFARRGLRLEPSAEQRAIAAWMARMAAAEAAARPS